jgi:hypothetical protein
LFGATSPYRRYRLFTDPLPGDPNGAGNFPIKTVKRALNLEKYIPFLAPPNLRVYDF